MYKIAIAGASTLLGKELKDALSDSPLAAANFLLLDEEDALGQLDQVGDEVTFMQAIEPDAFEQVDFTFFCGSEELTRKHWRQALRSGSIGARSFGCARPGNRRAGRAPWIGSERERRSVYSCCGAGASRRAGSGAADGAAAASRAGEEHAATVLVPASEFGRAAMDELHQQTVNLLSFQSMPRAIYDAQAAYNLLSGLGESAKASLSAVEARVRRHFSVLAANRWPALALQAILAPVFHGHTFSMAVELERPVEIAALEEAMSGDHWTWCWRTRIRHRIWRRPARTMCWCGCAASRNTRHPAESQRLWLWAASDNLRLYAQNAVECALDLRRLRPQGTVQ